MRLKEITAINFKNISEAKIALSDKVNCFVGSNGSGKTNMLDAIYYTSMCRSLTGSTDGQSTRLGTDFFLIDAQYINTTNLSPETIVCSLKKGGEKIVKRNGKRYDRLSDHIGVVPIILVSPFDSALINDAAEERRKFLNVLISQIDKEYLQSLIKYNSLLAQRNKLFKSDAPQFSSDYLEIVDMQLTEEATKIWRRREEFIAMLSPKVTENYAKIAGGGENVSLSYRSELTDNDYATILLKNFERDKALGYTYSGIHRDDMVIKIDSQPIKRFGSWGQQKSLLIALKLAEFDIIYSRRGVKPLLLLDDIFDKLDISRVESLIKLVYDDKYGQIFITDSNKTRLSTLLDDINLEYRLFDVQKGGDISLVNVSGENPKENRP